MQVGGPQHKEFRKEILQTMQVGVGRRNKFCENIISAPLPLAFTKFKCAIRIYV
ncbi:nitrogen fixation protein NifR [Staphylococcus aureus]|nr:nitrogen fixation protein NifR [Staphylococcus aureus]QOE20430.1 nitrogen fixation protein NifR [Staphylococcus aureus]